MAKKGSEFERSVCKMLSRWWSGELEDDSLFWRTSTSGARATVRARKGKKTSGGSGDICATSPHAQPLLEMVTVEIKRGYNTSTISDLLDRAPGAKKQRYEEWFGKVEGEAKLAGSLSWMLIHQRDRRRALCFFPTALSDNLEQMGSDLCCGSVRITLDRERDGKPESVTGMPLDNFLSHVTPDHVRQLVRKGFHR